MASYRTCPKCKSYNTLHVVRCYKCAYELGFPSVFRDVSESAPLVRPTWMDSRSSERYAHQVTATVLEMDESPKHNISIDNISAGGLQFSSDWPYLEFDRFYLELPLFDGVYRVEVIVRRCQSIAFGQNRFAVGVEFIDASPELCESIGLLPGSRLSSRNSSHIRSGRPALV